jgi:glycosyltransferase involved in cell wall biosynthesis
VKVLYLNPVGAVGGAERSLLDLCVAVRDIAPQLELGLLAGTDGPLLAKAEALGVPARLVPMPAALASVGDSGLRGAGIALQGARLLGSTPQLLGQTLRYLDTLRQEVKAFRPTLLHSNGIKTHLLSALLPRGCPVIWHLHDFLSHRPLAGRLLGLLDRRAGFGIAISSAVARDARSVLHSLPMDVVYNAVDTSAFSPGDSEGVLLDRLAGLPEAAPGTVRVGLVATYARWKGQDLFLEAAAQALLHRSPGVALRFYVIGGTVYVTRQSQWSEAELRNRARRLGITEEVGFIPFQDDLPPVYRALDVLVHASSRPEPFGLTIAEAMACGRPVIASRESGAAELFSDEEATRLSPLTAESLAGAICALARDPARRHSMATAARSAAVVRFSRQRLGREVLDIYRKTEREFLL